MEVNGLPLHPLVVHAAVVLGPVAALTALVRVAVPRWRDRLTWPLLVVVVLAVGAIVTAYVTGTSFLGSKPELQGSSAVLTHEHRARQLLWITVGFGVVALLDLWLARSGALKVVLDVLLAAAAVALLVWVVLTGDAGARAVWG
ncbi:DUF2231 domain-containing protein [Nocardioides sp.]|uniref:DUF2231 domain-containing protein n=1 Tax=Nocardioides sp. TaxID=35761 RepID=UPI0037837EE2